MPPLKIIDNLNVLSKFAPSMKLADWDAKIKYRGVDFKPPEDLEQARACYERKVPLLKSMLAVEKDTEQIQFLTSKIARLEDKYASVVMEQAYREAGLVTRVLHHTVYYIDLDGGSDAANGLGTGTAWLTLGQYTTTTVRTAGDIAYVRANTSEAPSADIVFDEDGTLAAPISIIGCDSVTNDPWSDASDVRPIVDFADGAFQMLLSGDNFWTITRLTVTQSADTNSNLYVSGCIGAIIDDCVFTEESAVTAYGMRISTSSALVQNCSFYNNKNYGARLDTSDIIVKNCDFQGGAGTTDYAAYLDDVYVTFIDCTFGTVTAHDLFVFNMVSYANAYLRNCGIAGSLHTTALNNWKIFSEDHNQVKGASYSVSQEGYVERDASPQLDSLDSILMTPGSTLGLGLTISQGYLNDYAVYCPASATTITIKARETAAWTTDPTADEFYFEASYLNHATAATRSTVKSAQTLSGTTEVSFTMTFTPAAAGIVYVTCYLKKYEAGKSVNVSVVRTVS